MADRRMLRSYQRTAMQEHSCCRCDHPILPGEQYSGEVWVVEELFQVLKYHDWCPDHPWDDDEWWREDEPEETVVIDFPTRTKVPLPKAA